MTQNVQLLRHKKRSLLLHSETIKDYPTLYKFIEENDDITEELIDTQLSEDDKKIVNDLLPNLLNLCQNEWQGDEFPAEILEGDQRIPCSLCGERTKNIFYITNKLSGERLNVGSTCIDEFPSDSIRNGKTKNQLLKEAKRNLALKQLNNAYPGIESIVTKWAHALDESDLLIPKHLRDPYLALGTKLKHNYEDFLRGSSECRIEDFRSILESQKSMLDAMTEYCLSHKNDRFIVNRRMVVWLKRRSDTTTLDTLVQTGYVTYDVIDKVLEMEFISSLVDEINEHLSTLNMAIMKIDEDMQTFVLKTKYNVIVNCKIDGFLKHFCGFLFNVKPNASLTEANIFRIGKLYDEASKKTTLSELNRKLRNVQMIIRNESDDYDYQFNEADLYYRPTGKLIILTNFDNFLNEFKHIAFNIGSASVQELVDFFNRKEYRKYTPDEINDIRQSSKELSRRGVL